ncbi:DNA-binding response regulator [Paenibacillus baekrokdamisoli]|uniref:DNA-binding response regulator n=1 Tax=Paenibacillus baekrokdamisoli TaxID=1712516 RepID=A0A3G9JCH8_9BACL|nr:response regulator [Paenibacillus baekrokdamisoli]MBB3068825.1 two-component system response regulator YesN [Paenibacillus baekrokdamisoli]BBH23651.1 DNA-binding response regulator [Paenibacillus baekrokdamisoli]
MYNVLLVDDEDLDLNALRLFIPWDQLNMKVAGAMNNAVSAMELINQTKLDILITDIRMPQMSGLELAKLALERNKDIRIIFISGHEDFTYAKQALSLNACSYILKPVDDEEVYEALTKVKELLDMEQSQKKTEKAYKEIAPLLKNELFLQLLEGKASEMEYPLYYEECGLPSLFEFLRVAVIEIDDVTLKLKGYNENERSDILKLLIRDIAHACRTQGYDAVFPVSSHRVAVIYADNQSSADDQWSTVADAFRIASSYSITIGLSREFTEVNKLSEAYRQALQALEYKMFLGKDRIIPFSDIKQKHVELAGNIDAQIEGLFLAIKNYDLLYIYDRNGDLFYYLKSIQSKATAYNVLLYVIVKLDTWLHTLNESMFGLLDIQPQNLEVIHHFETIDEIQLWLRNVMYELSEILNIKKQKKNQKLIKEIIDYIHLHIHEVVTLRNAANAFSYTPNYLGFLFKEEMDLTFTDYVIQARLLKAQELLAETHLKIYEVADKVGYRNLNYFSRQFKDSFGMSPLEFRKQC